MKATALLGIAGLAAFITYCFRQGAGARDSAAQARSDLRRWEGEGGSPAPRHGTLPMPPAASDGSSVRH